MGVVPTILTTVCDRDSGRKGKNMEPVTVGIILYVAASAAVAGAIEKSKSNESKKKERESSGFPKSSYDPKRGHPKAEKGRWV
jgi:hypothetical protein